MVRVVLTIAVIGLVLSLGVLPLDWRDPAVLVVDVLSIFTSLTLALAAIWRLRILRRELDEEDRDLPRIPPGRETP